MTLTKNMNTQFLTSTAMMTAFLCIVGPLSVPIGPVPVSLTNLAIYLLIYTLDAKRSTIACLLYMLIGLAGLPVFSGFSGGPSKLLGPTGGYIIGYLPMAFLTGLAVERYYENRVLCILAMEASTWILYLFGSAWLSYQANMTFPEALAVGVIPFIIVDLIKICIAALSGPSIRRRVIHLQ